MKKTIYLFLCLILLFSCKKDDKSDNFKEIYTGDFSLLKDSRMKFPYIGVNRLIYEDSLKNEIEFKLFGKCDTIITFTNVDSSKKVIYTYKISNIDYVFRQDSLGVTLMLSMHSILFDSAKVFDELDVKRNNYDELDILVNQRDLSNIQSFDTATSSINILGNIFDNVYNYSTVRKVSSKVFFNYVDGIVGFKDNNNKAWVYIKKE